MLRNAGSRLLATFSWILVVSMAAGCGRAKDPLPSGIPGPQKRREAPLRGLPDAGRGWSQIKTFAQSLRQVTLALPDRGTAGPAVLGIAFVDLDRTGPEGIPTVTRARLEGALESGKARLVSSAVPGLSAELTCADAACDLAEIRVVNADGRRLGGSATIRRMIHRDLKATQSQTPRPRHPDADGIGILALVVEAIGEPVASTVLEVVRIEGGKSFFALRIDSGRCALAADDSRHYERRAVFIEGDLGRDGLARFGRTVVQRGTSLTASVLRRVDAVYVPSQKRLMLRIAEPTSPLLGLTVGEEI